MGAMTSCREYQHYPFSLRHHFALLAAAAVLCHRSRQPVRYRRTEAFQCDAAVYDYFVIVTCVEESPCSIHQVDDFLGGCICLSRWYWYLTQEERSITHRS